MLTYTELQQTSFKHIIELFKYDPLIWQEQWGKIY